MTIKNILRFLKQTCSMHQEIFLESLLKENCDSCNSVSEIGWSPLCILPFEILENHILSSYVNIAFIERASIRTLKNIICYDS